MAIIAPEETRRSFDETTLSRGSQEKSWMLEGQTHDSPAILSPSKGSIILRRFDGIPERKSAVEELSLIYGSRYLARFVACLQARGNHLLPIYNITYLPTYLRVSKPVA